MNILIIGITKDSGITLSMVSPYTNELKSYLKCSIYKLQIIL